MKYLILNTLLLVLLSTTLAVAQQDKGGHRERMEALKIAFITEELALTSQEAEKFWVVYNQFETIRKEEKKAARKHNQVDVTTLSEAELQVWLEQHLKLEQQRLTTKQQYVQEFKKILPLQKVVKFLSLEHKFKRELLQKVRAERGCGESREGKK